MLTYHSLTILTNVTRSAGRIPTSTIRMTASRSFAMSSSPAGNRAAATVQSPGTTPPDRSERQYDTSSIIGCTLFRLTNWYQRDYIGTSSVGLDQSNRGKPWTGYRR
jgi:hypothetical protein